MKNLNIEIKKVEVQRLFLSENKVGYKIYFKSNDDMKNIYIELNLVNPEQIVSALLNEIKKREDSIVEDYDNILQSIVLVKINKQEEIEPKLIDFFLKFHGKFKSFKQKKTADNYMDIYNQLMREKLEL